MIVTSIPLLSRRAPNEAEVIPFPREETTPPVTNINLVDEFPIFCHTEKKGYSFKNDLMTHILDEMRYPTPSNGSIMSYLYKNKGWGFDFYIYTPKYIYFTNGIKNEKNKYFNIIPNLE